ncbi:MAG TPA: hypothetical protein VFC47_10985, partial [Caulobacteraceae bacterium]|nr:hypothetical protein [Caulobacteraceae bacterium]
MQPGEVTYRKGFITQASFTRLQDGPELERRMGFRPGRLGHYLSRGVPRGRLPANRHAANAEQLLMQDDFDLAKLKQKTITETSRLAGPDRLAKVVAVGAPTGEAGYPPGSGKFPNGNGSG